jgi:NTP pyrophosphatase (non-canonical NTP hydrolase)
MDLGELQATIRATYGDRDRARGVDATFGWFVEEVGELSRAIRRQGHDERVHEFSDALAWLVTLADLCGVDMAGQPSATATAAPSATPPPAPADCPAHAKAPRPTWTVGGGASVPVGVSPRRRPARPAGPCSAPRP